MSRKGTGQVRVATRQAGLGLGFQWCSYRLGTSIVANFLTDQQLRPVLRLVVRLGVDSWNYKWHVDLLFDSSMFSRK